MRQKQEMTKLLELDDVAGILGYTEETVLRLRREGRLKDHGRKTGRIIEYFFDPNDVWDLIRNSKALSQKISREDFDKKVQAIFGLFAK